MSLVQRSTAMLETMAVCCEAAFPSARSVLPIGGDHFTQLGLLTVLGVVLSEAVEMVQRLLLARSAEQDWRRRSLDRLRPTGRRSAAAPVPERVRRLPVDQQSGLARTTRTKALTPEVRAPARVPRKGT